MTAIRRRPAFLRPAFGVPRRRPDERLVVRLRVPNSPATVPATHLNARRHGDGNLLGHHRFPFSRGAMSAG
ncbi:hypothetical protein [Streptomyces globosus]|uniref:hypothetical protein n=1 Tax=Streptomyces globosus TaxID=68209 RepID=UPI003630EF0C